ncbi:hypothetical protein P7C71_g4569, partial [Lecanoromycetidae sp. Uapishka_2]
MPEPTEHVSESSSSRYLDQQLEQLASSVPDLAATLGTQEEEDNNYDNVNFLRAQLLEDDESDAYDDSRDRQRRMRRVVETISDAMVPPRVYTPAQLEELGNRQDHTYNGWAPGATSDDERPDQSSAALLDEHVLRRDEHLRERMRLRRIRDATHSEWRDLVASDATMQEHRGQSHFADNSVGGIPTVNESSLRTTALLQAVRRNPQFSARSRNELQRYILDRERGDDRDRTTPALRHQEPQSALSPSQRRQIQREATLRQDMQNHRDLLVEHQQHRNYLEEQLRQQRHGLAPPSENRRRRYWQTPNVCKASEKSPVDNAIRYLGQLCSCESDQEARETAEEIGFDPEDFDERISGRGIFLTDSQLVPPPPHTSWLQIGSVLSGTQHGASPSSLPSYTPLMPPSIYRARTRNPHFGSLPPRDPSPVRHTPSVNTEAERWPVKVTIHSIDYDSMTLSGTMEAFNVPDQSSPTKESSITTYLEGEIIDFNAFTLETKSFKAGTSVDGLYWRKLPPFRDLSDDETMVQRILSKVWLREELMEKWVLMRWKEKCFVKPSDAQTALTISGFYYVSLRRADGQIEGLYYDPHSNPYQHLSLTPEKGRMFPVYTFQ